MERREQSKTVRVVVAHDDGDDVGLIENGFSTRVPAPAIRGGPLAESAQIMLAGAISIRILADGLLVWLRTLKGTTLVCDGYSESGRIRIHKERTPDVRQILFIRPDGSQAVHEVGEGAAKVADELKALAG